MSGIPIIRFEVENLRHTVTLALQDYVAKMDADIQAAVAAAMTPENVSRAIRDAASKEIEHSIQREISDFFRFGNGRKAIKKAVTETLDRRAEEDRSDG